jgi:DNA-binding NarL/FixJ family response regulator
MSSPKPSPRPKVTRAGQTVVVSRAHPELPEVLSPSEAEVTRAILEGRTNAEIAARRGTSKKTVANQVHAICRKLSVCSRQDIAVLLFDSPPHEPDR